MSGLMRFYWKYPPSGMALKGWYFLFMGWIDRSWSVQAWCVSSKSQKRSCSCWMWRMRSSMWTSWCWEFSSWSSDWQHTWSCATKLSQSVKTSRDSHWWIWALVHILAVWDIKTCSLSFSVCTSITYMYKVIHQSSTCCHLKTVLHHYPNCTV